MSHCKPLCTHSFVCICWVGAGVMGGGHSGAVKSKPAHREGLLGWETLTALVLAALNYSTSFCNNMVDHNYDKSHKHDRLQR